MYIKVVPHTSLWGYVVHKKNGKCVLSSHDVWIRRWRAVRAARNMAAKLNIEYREKIR